MSDFNLLPNDQLPTQVNISDVTDTELDYVKQGQKLATGAAQSGWWNQLWASFWAMMSRGGMYVISQMAEVLDEIMSGIATFFVAAQGEKNAAFYDLTAKIVEDLTGVQVDANALKQSAFGSGRIAGMEQLGSDLYNILLSEFQPANGSAVVADTGPALRFLGFLLNFSIREGNIAVLSEMLPEGVDFARGFREYGTTMARNLGLGRMARRALQPLIQHLVSDPLTYAINAQYSPKRLNEGQLARGYFRQIFDLTRLRKELSEAGYSQELQDFIIDDSRPLVGDSTLIQLMFQGKIADPDFSRLMQARGYDANQQFLLTEYQRPTLNTGEIAHLWQHGVMSLADAITQMQKLGYDAATAQLALQAHALQTVHVPVIHFGELKRLLQENVIDVLEFGDRLRAQGYSDEDIQLLQLDALHPVKTKEKMLGLAQIKAAFKAGDLLGPTVIDRLTALGYSKDDATLILATFQTSSKTTTTPPSGTPPATA